MLSKLGNMINSIKKYIKLVPYIIIVGLIIALSVTTCSKQKLVIDNHESELKANINQKENELVAIQNRGEAKKFQWHKDSLEMKASENRFKQVAKKATKERDKARAKIQYLYDSIPEVKEFVDADSVSDQINLDRIREIGLEKISIVKSFDSMLSNKDEQLKVCGDLRLHVEQLNFQLKKDVRKERRRKTVWKVAASVLAVGILYQSINN